MWCSAWSTIVEPSAKASATRSGSTAPVNGFGRQEISLAYCPSEIVPPSLTIRRPGVRNPPEETSRSTSATDRRSSKRPSSARGTASGRCSQ